MNRGALITTLIVIAVVIVGVVLLTTGGTTETPGPNGTTTDDQQQVEDNQDQRRITAQQQFNADEGVHIVAGEMDLPTPCHVLEHDVEVQGEGENAEAVINFTTRMEDDDQACAQVITPQRFKVTFEAPENTDITATLNNEDVTLNLVPVPEGENLEEFEVFMKG